MRKKFWLDLIILSLVLCFSSVAFAKSLPTKKQTVLGLYVTAQQAFAKWHTNSDKIKILDVRTSGEYIFVGHAPMAANVPFKFLTGVNKSKKKLAMTKNKDFVKEVKKRFKKTDTIFLMCRSGGRSAAAVNMLAKSGFKNLYSVTDGFEGNALKVKTSYNLGKRVLDGWKNSGAPWTYKLDPNLVYAP
ncbi:MAG: sulfurtransferase [Desulfobacterales bacterium]|nr:sulfurtransferase [Desulfobacterales bacterium]MCP4158669.1 sulfurtransferase [Deltaproteobacteria bacterium]